MSQIRDNGNVSSTMQPSELPADPALQGGAEPTAPQTDAQRQTIHARNEKEIKDGQDDAQERRFMADFLKQPEDAPGYGANETADAKSIKATLSANGMEIPPAETMKKVNAAVSETPEFEKMVAYTSQGLEGAEFSPQTFNAMAQKTLSQHGLSATPSPATPKTVGAAATSSAPQQLITFSDGTASVQSTTAPAGTARAGQAATAEELPTMEYVMASPSNMTALVMLVLLNAKKMNDTIKRDTLQKIKGFNGALDDLNNKVSSILIPAQKELETMKNAKKDDKKFDASKLQVSANWPTSMDTKNFSQNSKTGEVVGNYEWGNAKTPSRQLVDSQGLSTLISQADQWRTSLQNGQTTQSNRFQAQDQLASSMMNIINAVCKNQHDGVNAIVRNV